MTAELEDRLRVAVEALSLPRLIPTTITDDDGVWLRIETVEHAPLLVQLVDDTGSGMSGKGSSGSGIPIDADRLEIWGQVVDRLVEWSHIIPFHFVRDNLPLSLQTWWRAFENRVRNGHVSEDDELVYVRTVESWVRMVENKFEPDKTIEWTDACYSCGVRRVVVDETERFAIQVNLTQQSAECAGCKKTWVGVKELMQLRYFTNLVAEGIET